MPHSSSRRWRAVAATAVAAVVALAGCAQDPAETWTPPAQVDATLPDATVEQINAAVQNAMTTTGATGAIVGVWAPWSGKYVAGIGTQAPDDATAVDPSMSFRITTLTRLMTCDLLYAMADDGVVELDAPVPDYVAGVADLEDITLLDLCNSTSGEGSSRPYVQKMFEVTPERVWPPLELAAFGLAEARTTPHTEYRDSDAGYLLLGMALERASGKSAQALVQEYITTPLGLPNTYLPSDAAAPPAGTYLRGNVSAAVEGGFTCTAQTDYSTMSASAGYTDSGVVSTIEDLGRYMQANGTQALRAEAVKDERYGSGLAVGAKAPSWYTATGGALLVGPLIGQGGSLPGYTTVAYTESTTGMTVAVVLNNSSPGSEMVTYLAWELAAIASKAPAAEGQTAPELAMPFTAEQYHQRIADNAGRYCVAPPAE